MNDVTAEEVKKAVQDKDIKTIDHHNCGLCHIMTKYIIEGDKIFFDPSCDCCSSRGMEERSWQEAADFINMQSNLEIKNKLAKTFGLEK